jgi:hypothetical protein
VKPLLLFILKMTLAPIFVALASLGGRRWGLAAAGWIGTLPIVAGPILYFFAVEQGGMFAAGAARQTLLGGVGFSCFALAYGWLSLRWTWVTALPTGWIAFLIPGLILCQFRLEVGISALLAINVVLLSQKLLPEGSPKMKINKGTGDWLDLLLRMLATAFLVVIVTGVARELGPTYSGVFAPFPVASAVLVAIKLLSGSLRGMPAFCVFCAVLAVGLIPLGVNKGFGLALLACALTQGLVYGWGRLGKKTKV